MAAANFGHPVRNVKDAPQSFVSMVSDFSISTDSTESDESSQFKVRIHTLHMVGREAEVESLRASYNSVADTGKSELVFCRGFSGVGKSKLVQSLRDPVFAQGGFFVTGKFDQLLSNAPYSAIAAALSDLCDLIHHSPDRDEICDAIRAAFPGSEINVLAKLIPSLKYLIGDFGGDNGLENSQQAFTRFKILCGRFLEVLATEKHPLVLVLDDLQWSDHLSVTLIKSFLQQEDTHLLVICAYRDKNLQEEEDTVTSSPLSVLLEDCARDIPEKVKRVHLSGLGIDSINRMVSYITNRDLHDTHALSEVVHQKTMGNAYFCVRFLEMLEAHDFLWPRTDELTGQPIEPTRWEWNLSAIKSDTNATDNVASLVMEKVQRVKSSVQLVLIYCAYLGYRFPLSLLKQIIVRERAVQDRGVMLNALWAEARDVREDVLSDSDLSIATARALHLATSEGLVEQIGEMEFKFSHDRVQDCLMKMMTEERDLSLLRLRIGRVIHRIIKSQTGVEDWMVFLAADNLNEAEHLVDDSEEQLMLVALNLEAGKLAATNCAYVLASDYLRRAIRGLSEESWVGSYSLSLKVYEFAAETEYCTGNSDRSQELIRVIKEKAICKEDTMRGYQTEVASLTSEGNFENALEVGLFALRLLGIKIPNPRKTVLVHVAIELAKTKHALRKYSFDELQQLPPMQNANMVAASKMISAAGLSAFLLFEAGKSTFALLCLRGLRLTLKFGLCSLSTQAFAAYGAIMSILGNRKLGCQYADVSRKLSEESNTGALESRTVAVTHAIVLHWNTALVNLHEGLGRAYKSGMEHADIIHAYINYHNFVLSALLLGLLPFSKIEEHALSLEQIVDEFKLTHFKSGSSALSIRETIMHMMGRSECDPSMLCAEISAELDNLVVTKARSDRKLIPAFCALILAYHFENIRLIEKCIVAVEKNRSVVKGNFQDRFILFYFGMSNYLLHKCSGKRIHLSRARKMTSIFCSWSKKGYANTAPYVDLLNMELVASTISDRKVQYDTCQKAIDTCEKENLGVPWALCYERATSIMLEVEDRTKALQYAKMAMSLYGELEMYGKVQFLEDKWSSLLDPDGV